MLSGIMSFLLSSPCDFMAETTLEREQPSLSAMFWMVRSVSSRNCKVSRSKSSGIWFQWVLWCRSFGFATVLISVAFISVSSYAAEHSFLRTNGKRVMSVL